MNSLPRQVIFLILICQKTSCYEMTDLMNHRILKYFCFQILLSDKFNLGTIVQNILFGFVVSRSVSFAQFSHVNALYNTLNNLDSIISQFWETDKVPEIFSEYSSEQEVCEINFPNSLEIVDGKFQVALPPKHDLND